MRSCLFDSLSAVAFTGFGLSAILHLATFVRFERFLGIDLASQYLPYFACSSLLAVVCIVSFGLAVLIEFAHKRILIFLSRSFLRALPWQGRWAMILVWIYLLFSVALFFRAMGMNSVTVELEEVYMVRVGSVFFLFFYLQSALYYRYAVSPRISNSERGVA